METRVVTNYQVLFLDILRLTETTVFQFGYTETGFQSSNLCTNLSIFGLHFHFTGLPVSFSFQPTVFVVVVFLVVLMELEAVIVVINLKKQSDFLYMLQLIFFFWLNFSFPLFLCI